MHKGKKPGQSGEGPGKKPPKRGFHNKDQLSKAPAGKGSSGDPLINQVIDDKYVIKELHAIGGMGKVYLALDKENLGKEEDAVVAVKFLRPEFSKNKVSVKRFMLEAEAAMRIKHPNVARTYDFGMFEDDKGNGGLYLVMEFVRGVSLHQLTANGQTFPWRLVGYAASEICDALSSAHKLGLMHRDIKPGNIMLTAKRERGKKKVSVKLLDFGITKSFIGKDAIPEDAGLPQSNGPYIQSDDLTQGVVGTPSCMAPEQVMGKECDNRVDIYALGSVMYKMLCGTFPFIGDDREMRAKKIVHEAELLSERAPNIEISKYFENVVMCALRKSIEKRFGNAIEFKEAIKEAVGDFDSALEGFDLPEDILEVIDEESSSKGHTVFLLEHLMEESKESEKMVPPEQEQSEAIDESEAQEENHFLKEKILEDLELIQEEERPRGKGWKVFWYVFGASAIIAALVFGIKTAYEHRKKLPPWLQKPVVNIVETVGDLTEQAKDYFAGNGEAKKEAAHKQVTFTVNTWPGEASVFLATDGEEEIIGETDKHGKLVFELPEGKHTLIIRKAPHERKVEIAPDRATVNVTFKDEDLKEPTPTEEKEPERPQIKLEEAEAVQSEPDKESVVPIDDVEVDK